jgi:hypothetical protein
VAPLALACACAPITIKPSPVVVVLAPPNPAASLTRPGEVGGQLFIGADEAWKLLAVDVQREPAALPVPFRLRRPGTYLWAVFRFCARVDGSLSTATMLRSADRLVDADWMSAVRRWRFKPLLRDGAPRAFCSDMPVGAKVEWDNVRPPGVNPATRSLDE